MPFLMKVSSATLVEGSMSASRVARPHATSYVSRAFARLMNAEHLPRINSFMVYTAMPSTRRTRSSCHAGSVSPHGCGRCVSVLRIVVLRKLSARTCPRVAVHAKRTGAFRVPFQVTS